MSGPLALRYAVRVRCGARRRGPNALFVSTAALLNSDALLPIIEWFRKLAVVGPGGVSHDFTSTSLRSTPDLRPRMVGFLQGADIAVSDVRVREEEIDLDLDELASPIPEAVREELRGSASIEDPGPGVRIARSRE